MFDKDKNNIYNKDVQIRIYVRKCMGILWT